MRAGAWRSRPPAYQRHISLVRAYPFWSKKRGLPFFQSDWWVCMPEPLSMNRGLGMKVATLPCLRATFFTMYLYQRTLSAICVKLVNRMSISFWPRSEEHTSELQSRGHLVCRLLLEKKKKI